MFDKVDATFQPLRADDLVPGMRQWIGHRDIWECNGAVEHSDYAGQASFYIATDIMNKRYRETGKIAGETGPPCAWIPECDLIIHKEVCPSCGREMVLSVWTNDGRMRWCCDQHELPILFLPGEVLDYDLAIHEAF